MRLSRTFAPLALSVTVFRLGERAAELIGEQRTEGNQPVQRFRKELVRVGKWVHPQDGRPIPITRANLEHWAAQFARMQKAGVKVPVPLGHTNDPSKNRGYVVGMSVEGDRLLGDIDLIGDDAIKLAGRTEVSIFVPSKIVDGHGNEYQLPIEHVALVTDPVIPGQTGFEPIAASRNAPVYRLANGGSSMEFLKQLAAALGVSVEGLDEAAVQKAVLDKVKEMEAARKTDAEAKKAAETELAASKEQVKTLQASRGKPIEVDPDVFDVVRGAHTATLNRLVETGALAKPNADKLAKALCLSGDNGGAAALCLSKKAATAAGFPDGLATLVLSALDGNKPAPLGEATGPQSFGLSRETPGGGAAITPDAARKAAEDLASRLGIAKPK